MAGDFVIFPERQKDNNFAYFNEGAKKVYMTYREFLATFTQEDREYHYYYSFDDPPVTLMKDIVEPELTNSVLELEKITYWHGFGTATKGHTDSMENIMCVFTGYKNFTIISPDQRPFLYSGYNNLPDNYSPVDFNYPDLEKWPEFRKVKMFKTQIAEGDCLFVPAYWWH